MPLNPKTKIHYWPSFLPMTDEQAIGRVQQEDDEPAFAQLVARWQQPILRLCSRMMGDAHRGEDLTQETFARVYSGRKDFRPGGRFSTWLWRIALNLCYDELRKRRSRGEGSCEELFEEPVKAAEEPPSDALAPDLQLVAREEGELTREALMRLSEEDRSVLVLRYCEGLKLREVAEVLQLPETTVSSRIAAALGRITRILEPGLAREQPAVPGHPSRFKSLQIL
jgi:RNA polymerase sigma-70 factor (ECF subfamily)